MSSLLLSHLPVISCYTCYVWSAILNTVSLHPTVVAYCTVSYGTGVVQESVCTVRIIYTLLALPSKTTYSLLPMVIQIRLHNFFNSLSPKCITSTYVLHKIRDYYMPLIICHRSYNNLKILGFMLQTNF